MTLAVRASGHLRERFWNYPDADPNALRVEVTARQWAWTFRTAGPDGSFATPDDVVTLNELHVPVGRPVYLKLRSKDVVHSLLPAELPHQDRRHPGQHDRLWFQAQEAGRFEIGCAQHCGVSHYKMRGWLIAAPEDEYRAWLARAETDSRLRYDRRADGLGLGDRHDHARRALGDAVRRLRRVFSTDHKVIAKQFLFLGPGVPGRRRLDGDADPLAVARPGQPVPLVGRLLFRGAGGVISPAAYTSLFTMHGTIMIFFAVTPILIGGFGNFCMPLHDRRARHGVPAPQHAVVLDDGGGDRDADRVVLRAAGRGAGGLDRLRAAVDDVGTPGRGPDAVDGRRST